MNTGTSNVSSAHAMHPCETLRLAKRTLDWEWAYAKAWLFRCIREHT
ncbi:MAG: hypothetical protein QOG17_1513 [Gammaproteobacteria bacterium]|jgi:hypothetical protein|nr:hypothetical protein [Gammaproteobacteria bacterium]